MKNRPYFLLFIFILLLSCTESKNKDSNENAIKLKQYKIAGQELYNIYCVNCHQSHGEGFLDLYPPLKDSDFLLENFERAACIIQNGQQEPIVVNGKEYKQGMPENAQLTPLEIAEILTFVLNNWGHTYGLQEVKTVEKWLQNCEE